MSLHLVVKTAVRDTLGPVLRSDGYKGSSPTWRKTNAAGDVAIVNFQNSSWNTSEKIACVINIAMAPEPWLRWWRERQGDRMMKTVGESLGLYRDRLHPSGSPPNVDTWWRFEDEASAIDAVADMAVRWEASGRDVLDALLDREVLFRYLDDGDLGHIQRRSGSYGIFFARARALLLMDKGPSEALERSLEQARENLLQKHESYADHFESWVRQQASAAAI